MIKITPYSTAFQRTLCWGGLSMLDLFLKDVRIWDKRTQPRVVRFKNWQEKCLEQVNKQPLAMSGSRILEKVYAHLMNYLKLKPKGKHQTSITLFAVLYFVIGCKCACAAWTNTKEWEWLDKTATKFFKETLEDYPQSHDDGYQLYCELLEIAGA